MKEYLDNIPERVAIEKLGNTFNKNQESMKNFAFSEEQMERIFLKIIKNGKNEGDMLEAKILYYSSLNELSQAGKDILNISILRYKKSIDVDFHNNDMFIKGIEKINNNAIDLFRKRAKILYEEEINSLINIPDSEIQRNILFPEVKANNLKDLYPKNLIAFNQLISKTEDSGFNLIEYHNSKLLELDKRYSENDLMGSNLKNLVQFIKKNSIECFESYVVNKISTTSSDEKDQILMMVPTYYIPAFKNSLKIYIKKMEKYVIDNNKDFITKYRKVNDENLEEKHIHNIFDVLEKEVCREIDKILK